AREDDQVPAGLEGLGCDLGEVRLGGRLDDDAGGVDQVVEREKRGGGAKPLEEPLGLLSVTRRRPGEPEARKAPVERAADRAPDRAEADDADVHDEGMLSCRSRGGMTAARTLRAARDQLARYGTLEKVFLAGDPDPRGPIGPALERFARSFLETDLREVFPRGRLSRGYRHLFPLPSAGGPCKRLNLFLRWMVRRA